MITFRQLTKNEDELAIVLRQLENLIENREGKTRKTPFYSSLKGNLLLILKHQLEFKLRKFEDLSIPDMERLVGILSHFKMADNSLKEELNRLLDKKFQKICGSCLLIKIEYENPHWFNPYRFPCCDSEILFHYIIAKEKLNKLEDMKSNKKLTFLLRKTYDSEKSSWFKEKHLRPNQNKWVHFFVAINKLEVLNPEEKEAILKHNAELKINKKLPVMAQLWNRIYLFKGLGVENIEELRNILLGNREFLEVKKNICGFFPETLNLEKEDLFNEVTNLMRSKHASIKNFCNAK